MLDEAAANAHSQHSVHFQKADCTDTLQYRIQQLLQLCFLLYAVQIDTELIPADSSGNIIGTQHMLHDINNA